MWVIMYILVVLLVVVQVAKTQVGRTYQMLVLVVLVVLVVQLGCKTRRQRLTKRKTKTGRSVTVLLEVLGFDLQIKEQLLCIISMIASLCISLSNESSPLILHDSLYIGFSLWQIFLTLMVRVPRQR